MNKGSKFKVDRVFLIGALSQMFVATASCIGSALSKLLFTAASDIYHPSSHFGDELIDPRGYFTSKPANNGCDNSRSAQQHCAGQPRFN